MRIVKRSVRTAVAAVAAALILPAACSDDDELDDPVDAGIADSDTAADPEPDVASNDMTSVDIAVPSGEKFMRRTASGCSPGRHPGNTTGRCPRISMKPRSLT